jgi:hypothetical protein
LVTAFLSLQAGGAGSLLAQKTKKPPAPKVKIPPGSVVYVEPMNGFAYYVMAELFRAKVPVSITLDKKAAGYVISGGTQAGGLNPLLFAAGLDTRHYSATIRFEEAASNAVLFSDDINSHFDPAGYQGIAFYFVRHLRKHLDFVPSESGNTTTKPTFNLPVKVFVDQMNGYRGPFVDALLKKETPVTVVETPEVASFVINGNSVSFPASTAKKVLLFSWHSEENAAIAVSDPKTQRVVYAVAYGTTDSAYGERSSAEGCAKELKFLLEGKPEK